MRASTAGPGGSGIRRWHWVALAASLLISILLRVPYFQHSFIFVDEAWWANGAKALLEGKRLYQDIWLDKQPPIFLFAAGLFRLLGVSMAAIHAGSLLLVGIVSILLFCIGASFFSPAVGGAASILYALASTTYYLPRILGMNTETLMVVFTSGAMYCFLCGTVKGRTRWIFWAGLLSSLAVITKPVAATELVLFFLLLAAATEIRPRQRLQRMGLLAAGGGCGLLLLLTYVSTHGILVPWWQQTILYEFQYVGEISRPSFLMKLPRSTLVFCLIYSWLLLLIRGTGGDQNRGPAFRTIAWWVLSAFLGVAAGRRFYANYFIQLLPPLVLLGAAGAVSLWDNRGWRRNRMALRLSAVALLLSFAWFHASTAAHWYFFLNPEAHRRVQFWGMCREDRKTAEIARYLESATQPHHTIFVWGPRPELYFLSKRTMTTPFMEYDVGMNVPPGSAQEDGQMEILQRLRTGLPIYVVDVQRTARMENFPHFNRFLKENYTFETNIHGTRLYRLRNVQIQNNKSQKVNGYQ